MRRLTDLLNVLDEALIGAPRALAEALRLRPLAAVALALLLGILLGEYAPVGTIVFAVAVVVALLGWLALWRLDHQWAAAPLLLAVCGAGAVLHRAERQVPATDISHYVGRWVEVQARVCEEPSPTRRQVRFVAQAESVRLHDLAQTASGRLLVSVPQGAQPAFGDLVRFEAELREPGGASNSGEFDYRAHLARRNIRAQCFAAGVTRVGGLEGWRVTAGNLALRARHRLLSGLEGAMPGAQPKLFGDLLASLVYGLDAAPLPDETVEPFRRTGTVHVLVVSGAQVSMLVAGLFAVLRASARRFRLWQAVLAILVVLAFAAIVGFGPSVSRAAGMTLLTLLAWRIHRRPDVYTALAFAGMVLCLLDTDTLFDIGAQMSFAACFGVAHFTPRQAPGPEAGVARRYLRPAAQGTLGAWLFVVPLVAYHFHTLPLTGAIANLAIVPLATALLGVGVVVSGLIFVSGALAAAASAVGRVLILGMLYAVDLGAHLPYACVEPFFLPWTAGVAWCAGALFALHVIRSPRELLGRERALVLAVAAVAVATCVIGLQELRRPLTVTVMSVGDGACALIQSPSGENVLVDGGRQSRRGGDDLAQRVILPTLARQFAGRLDVVLATHADADHINALPAVFAQEPPRLLLEPCLPHPGAEYATLLQTCDSLAIPRRQLRRGGIVNLGRGARLTFLAPFDPPLAGTSNDLNNNSAVGLMQYGHCRILLCGDIEAEAEEALVAAGDDLRADVLLAPHHGSASSSTPGFVAAVHPRAVIFSVGASKALGNPDPEVVARYQAAGARVFRTDTQGSIQVTTDGRRLTVRAYTGGARYRETLNAER